MEPKHHDRKIVGSPLNTGTSTSRASKPEADTSLLQYPTATPTKSPLQTEKEIIANTFLKRGDFNYFGINALVYSSIGDKYFCVSNIERSIYDRLGIKQFKKWYMRVSEGFYTAYSFNGHRLGGFPTLRSKMVIAEAFTRHDELIHMGINFSSVYKAYHAFSLGDTGVGFLFTAIVALSLPFTILQRYNRSKMQDYFECRERNS
jgi:hypothetical protein